MTPDFIFAAQRTRVPMTASKVASLMKWQGMAGDGIRLHYMQGDIDAITARKLLKERVELLSGMCDLFLFIPPKALDIFLAPAHENLGGPHIFPKTWTVLTTWYGKGCEEELCPGRTVAKMFIHYLAGEPRKPHPFILAGLSRLCSKSKKSALTAHQILKSRATADGLKFPLSISTYDLPAKDERAKQKAASFFLFLKEFSELKHLAALPKSTAATVWTDELLTSQWQKATRGLSGVPDSRFLIAKWNELLNRVEPNLSKKSPHYRAAKDALAAEEETLTKCLVYRDSPRLQFVAHTRTKQVYLLGYSQGKMIAEKRLRQRAPSFSPLRLRANDLERSLLTAQQLGEINSLIKKRALAAGQGNLKRLENSSARDWDSHERTNRAKRLIRQLRAIKVKKVQPIFEVTSELDLGPAQGKITVNQRIVFQRGKPVLLEESWEPLH